MVSLGLIDDLSNDMLEFYLRIFLLLYADDTVLISESAEGMQKMLDTFRDYCKEWKLNVNVEKTKVVIFSKKKIAQNVKFMFNDNKLDVCDSYNYLGILFHYNSNLDNTKKKLVQQAQKALYSVYYKIRNINIPIDLQLKIFDTLVRPILLYGCEVIGYEKNDNIEKVHLQFLKKILKVRATTPSHLVYGELGRFPLIVDIKCRILCFWNSLVGSNKLSAKFALLQYNLNKNGLLDTKWIKFVKSTFNEVGLTFIFSDYLHVSSLWLKTHAKQILKDQFVQKWYAELTNTSRGQFYLKFKNEFVLEPYLLRLNPTQRLYITKLRLSNIKFPVETGRWRNVQRDNRICTKCNSGEVGSEFHYLFICQYPDILEKRLKHIPRYYINNPSETKMIGLLKYCHNKLLINLASFVKQICPLF